MRKKVVRVVVSALVVLGLLIGGFGCAKGPEEVKIVKFGLVDPLSGPAAMWGIPSANFLKIWEEEVNAAGGIKVGGETYNVKVVEYDDEYVPDKVLVGFKMMVSEENVATIFCNTLWEAACGYTNEAKMLTWTTYSGDCSGDYPYVFDVLCSTFDYQLAGIVFIAQQWPEAKRIAIVCQDTLEGDVGRAFDQVSAEVMGLDIVYNKPFAVETVDFAPVVTAILATEPDIITFAQTWPAFSVLLIEQCYLQGYKGIIVGSSWDLAASLAKVGKEYAEGRMVSHCPEWDDPTLPDECLRLWNKYIDRFGRDKWQWVGWLAYDAAMTWKRGVELADSFDSTEICKVLRAQDEIPSTIGPMVWFGEEYIGAKSLLTFNEYPITVIQDGHEWIGGYISPTQYYEANKEYILRRFEELGLVWHPKK